MFFRLSDKFLVGSVKKVLPIEKYFLFFYLQILPYVYMNCIPENIFLNPILRFKESVECAKFQSKSYLTKQDFLGTHPKTTVLF